MSNAIRHQLTGYDRRTDVLVVEHDIDSVFDKVKTIVDIGPDDPDAVGSYPLSNSQIRAIADLLGTEFDNDRYEFFVEPVAAPRARARASEGHIRLR
jgi:hypothetical protein